MKLTFKDVGQGDSIVIEWEYKGQRKVGIIDCKMKGKSNPVLNHIKYGKYAEIEFIILSHPHSDHYSGLEELLDFCEREGIIIQKFGHTIKDIGIEYFRWFETGNSEQRQLARIIKLANSLKDKGILKKFVMPTEDWSIELSESIKLHSLSPSHDEIMRFQEVVEFESQKNKKAASKAANFLSTVFHLKASDSHVLLTSDAEKETFQRIYSESRMIDKPLRLGQAPHHGSFNNYLDQFWDNIPLMKEKVAVFSAGLNIQYQHPHLEVIRKFEKNGFIINATNIVYGMKQYINILRKTLLLDTVSELSEEHLTGGDKVFTYQ
jgi:beta-lactamase superfamily II metal-dependent hydrolase